MKEHFDIAIYAEQCATGGSRCGDPERIYGDREKETDDLVWYSGTAEELEEIAVGLDRLGPWGWRAARSIRDYIA